MEQTKKKGVTKIGGMPVESTLRKAIKRQVGSLVGSLGG